jgi:hypothetical protein
LQHTHDVTKIFIGIPASAHALQVKFKGVIRQAITIKDAHTTAPWLTAKISV